MHNPYKTREGGATCTIFVPYDCGNNCPFCINKEEYQDMDGFSVEKICESIKLIDSITPKCDFVFTGGEPLANLESLQTMMDLIPPSHRIFINTTFPVLKNYTADEVLAFVERNKDKITCINISRHVVSYVEEGPDSILGRLPVPARINCVLYKDYPKAKLPEHIERFRQYNLPIQFRYDYTDTTPENLYEEEHDQILHDLREICTYTGLDGCRMRNGYHFLYNGLEITYHKTLPYSTIVEEGEDGVVYDILYDIVLKQTGVLHSDWDGTVLDVEGYKNVVFEPYDLRWLEGGPVKKA